MYFAIVGPRFCPTLGIFFAIARVIRTVARVVEGASKSKLPRTKTRSAHRNGDFGAHNTSPVATPVNASPAFLADAGA